MEKEFLDFKNKMLMEMAEVRADIKIVTETQKALAQTMGELKEINKNFTAVLTHQERLQQDVHDLYVKYNTIQTEANKQFAQCPVHSLTMKNLKEDVYEIKDLIRNRDKALAGIIISIVTYVILQVLKII